MAATPDPDSLEPIMTTDPAEAEVVRAAAMNTIGRLRYYAQHDPHLRGLVEEFDAAVATGLTGVPPGDVAARTHTEPAPTEQEQEFEALLEASSLGSPAAKALRERAPEKGSLDAALVRTVFDRALRYADRDWEGLVELLMAAPSHVLRQVRLTLADIAGIASEAQRRALQPAEPAPDA